MATRAKLWTSSTALLHPWILLLPHPSLLPSWPPSAPPSPPLASAWPVVPASHRQAVFDAIHLLAHPWNISLQPETHLQSAKDERKSICVFPEKELRGLSPNFHIYVSESDFYIHRNGPFLQEKADQSWKYINRSQTHQCGNWDWGRQFLFWQYLFFFYLIFFLLIKESIGGL